MQTPAQHPFNPLALLRLALACGPNRRVVQAIFHHVWQGGGADANDAARVAELTSRLTPALDPAGEDVKRALREATGRAIAAGIFGVPSYLCEDRLFWGLDALPMLRAALQRDPWFDGPAWDTAAQAPPGVVRAG
jgi:2-hydroxychromene-2-carboxylate isomerase